MSAQYGTKFFWSDWLGDPAVRRLTPAERGLWIDCLALMAAASPVGYLCDVSGRPLTHEEIARVTNAASPVEVADLIVGILEKGAASRDRTGRVFNRRMVRDASLRAKRASAGQKGGQTTIAKYRALQGNDHLLKQVPKQKKSRAPPPYLKENKNLASLSSEPRARPPVARPPVEQAAKGKPPAEATKADFEAIFAAKRKPTKE